MKNFKFIHNETGKEVECACEDVKVENLCDDQVYFCKIKIGEEEKTVGIFSCKHFSMYVVKSKE